MHAYNLCFQQPELSGVPIAFFDGFKGLHSLFEVAEFIICVDSFDRLQGEGGGFIEMFESEKDLGVGLEK